MLSKNNSTIQVIPNPSEHNKNPRQTQVIKKKKISIKSCSKYHRYNIFTYFQDSEFYAIKDMFYAEVIYDVHKKLSTEIGVGIILDDLWKILTRSCNRLYDADKEFKEKININEVALNVNIISIVSNQHMPVAFISARFIKKNIFYINSALVLPDYVKYGIAPVNMGLVCKLIYDKIEKSNRDELFFVFRTHNKRAATSMLHAFTEKYISTESNLPSKIDKIFQDTADSLKCNYNKETGISYDIYPKNLPEGETILNERVLDAFKTIGPTDACYCTGQINEKIMNSLFNRYIKRV